MAGSLKRKQFRLLRAHIIKVSKTMSHAKHLSECHSTLARRHDPANNGEQCHRGGEESDPPLHHHHRAGRLCRQHLLRHRQRPRLHVPKDCL